MLHRRRDLLLQYSPLRSLIDALKEFGQIQDLSTSSQSAHPLPRILLSRRRLPLPSASKLSPSTHHHSWMSRTTIHHLTSPWPSPILPLTSATLHVLSRLIVSCVDSHTPDYHLYTKFSKRPIFLALFTPLEWKTTSRMPTQNLANITRNQLHSSTA